MTAIFGNTYPVKDQLKALGAKWNVESKCWMVPDEKAEAARKLVEGASQQSATPGKCAKCGTGIDPKYTLCLRCKPAPTKCIVCGHKPAYGDRYDKIYKSGECRDCYEERKMGY